MFLFTYSINVRKMLSSIVLCILTLRFHSAVGQGECTDLRGRLIAHGLHYVPGPDTCTLCICDNGLPKVCKAVLCSPPQDCRSFRVGNTCCEFICLDDVVKPAEGAEANVRVAAGGAAAVVLLTVALVVYRVRRQKRRRPPHADDQRSLTSIGYISGSMAYMGGTCETALAAWKPPGNYLPRGEAPPPYDEVVAQCRAEAARGGAGEAPYHRSYPAALETLARPDDALPCSGHSYANIPRPIQQLANPAYCNNAPLLQPALAEPREPPAPHHPLAPNMVGFSSAIRLTGSLGAISNRGLLSLLQREPEPERPHNVPGMYPGTAPHSSAHRTIPRISTGVDTCALDGLSGFLPPRALAGEVRRSFHKPAERHSDRAATGRSVPRNLNIASADTPRHVPHLPHDMSNVRVSASGVNNSSSSTGVPTAWRGGAGAEGGELAPLPPPAQLPLTVDKPSCVCSYAGGGGGGAGAEEADDYRSECENCKATNNSRWAVEPEGWARAGGEGTQTLQRRAPPPAAPAAATATLPQPVTKQPRTLVGPPSNWENWFNTIPDSDTESEEE